MLGAAIGNRCFIKPTELNAVKNRITRNKGGIRAD